MSEVFADSGYWIAMSNPSDNWHESAKRATQLIGDRKIITTEMVLVELFAYMSRRGPNGRRQAASMLDHIKADPAVEVFEQTHEQFEKAASEYASRLDQRWSLTDCASFLLMESRGVTEALAHDRDFLQAGFIPLMRDA